MVITNMVIPNMCGDMQNYYIRQLYAINAFRGVFKHTNPICAYGRGKPLSNPPSARLRVRWILRSQWIVEFFCFLFCFENGIRHRFSTPGINSPGSAPGIERHKTYIHVYILVRAAKLGNLHHSLNQVDSYLN